ncbi:MULTISPECIES: hypothetical protein [Alteromonas]|uniref:hypothetical protein n=1 Tax=Alteromonas TaxID=226 RepID=UPI000C995D36|nr:MULTISPECIES: hypothetical protein [Alteromonas]MAD45067.1 hypothetical protein [Oceanospirillaceae bacterium]QPL49126.1 hypothetical protein IUA53_14925 [Alteromonas sp. B31-7]|tara:strand:- start:7050 stop:8192 length:1143 start_codon:yes stop_codon:yes gene_type:complete
MEQIFTLGVVNNKEMLTLLETQIRYLLPPKSKISTEHSDIRVTSENDLPQALIDNIQGLIDETKKSYRKVNLMQSKASTEHSIFTQDPMPVLLESNQLVQMMPGIYTYSGALLELMQKLDEFFRQYALREGASERLYPNILPVNSMIENGYVSGFPHHALFVSMAHQDSDTLKSLSALKDIESLNDLVSTNGIMLAPTVCHHCFEELKGAKLEDNMIITSTGKCHRFEGPSAEDLSRTHIFNMREIVLFGKSSWVHKNRLKIKSDCEALFERWQLDYQVETATDPFFPAGSQNKRNFQAMNQTKFEVKLYLPFKQQSISAVSINNHMETLTESYGIKGGKNLISSCVGFGLERLSFSILSQYGFDRGNWPDTLKEDLVLE